MQVAPPGGQICDFYKWCQLVAKFWTNACGGQILVQKINWAKNSIDRANFASGNIFKGRLPLNVSDFAVWISNPKINRSRRVQQSGAAEGIKGVFWPKIKLVEIKLPLHCQIGDCGWHWIWIIWLTLKGQGAFHIQSCKMSYLSHKLLEFTQKILPFFLQNCVSSALITPTLQKIYKDIFAILVTFRNSGIPAFFMDRSFVNQL